MIKKLTWFIFIFLIVGFGPFTVNALSEDYNDLLYQLVDEKIEEDKVNIYLFYGDGCPHCAKEKVLLDELLQKYDNINLYTYETWKNAANDKLMLQAKNLFDFDRLGVPFTVIGEEYFYGYNDAVGKSIEETVRHYLELEVTEDNVVDKDKFTLPLLGEVHVKDASIGLIAIILGIVDGFNPCAMWILLFLINMMIPLKDKKKMFILGFAFLFTSALVYFLSMLGMSFILSMVAVLWLRNIVAVVGILAGVWNIKNYIETRNSDGCHVVDAKKRKNIFQKVQKFTKEKNIFLALGGVVALAISVNLVELACSVGFPAIFADILAINDISGVSRIFYLLLYVMFYMLDDMVVFTIAVATLSISASSTKYTKYVHLIAGIIMIGIGFLLLFKPEWVMLNF